MSKIYFIATAALLIVFSAGFLVGKAQNDSGRYFLKEFDDAILIFDTKTGKGYTNFPDEKKYFEIDIINGQKKEYKAKK